MCQKAYCRKCGGQSRPVPRIRTNRSDENTRSQCTFNNVNQTYILETDQGALSRTTQKKQLITLTSFQ